MGARTIGDAALKIPPEWPAVGACLLWNLCCVLVLLMVRNTAVCLQSPSPFFLAPCLWRFYIHMPSMESTGCQYYYFSLPLVLVPPFPIYTCCKINILLYAGCLYGKFTYSHMQPVIVYQKLPWKSLHMHLMHPLAAVYGCLLKTSWCALLH